MVSCYDRLRLPLRWLRTVRTSIRWLFCSDWRQKPSPQWWWLLPRRRRRQSVGIDIIQTYELANYILTSFVTCSTACRGVCVVYIYTDNDKVTLTCPYINATVSWHWVLILLGLWQHEYSYRNGNVMPVCLCLYTSSTRTHKMSLK